MKKILMRAGMSPIAENQAAKVLAKNLIGDNIGNMLFATSMAKNVMSDDTTVETILTNRTFSKEEIEKFNSEYECFIIPLANAFRVSFIKELNAITNLVKQLTIPCVITGVGIQVRLNATIDRDFSFDDAVRQFMDAILEKSSMVGVRGEVTGSYLKKLGYIEEQHYTVIGCPSMYMFGKELPKAPVKELTSDSNIGINFKMELPQNMLSLFERSMKQIPNFHFIPQSINEHRLMFAGVPVPVKADNDVPEFYPLSLASDIYRNDKVVGFVNLKSWLDFLNKKDFVFGSRIHGNMASILAGTPCYIFAYDSRITELATYHNIPFMPASKITDSTNIFDIHQTTDFSSIYNGHEQRFNHFIDFLNKNNVPHIYDKDGNPISNHFNEVLDTLNLEPPIHSFSSLSIEEQEQRLASYYKFNTKKAKAAKKEEPAEISGKLLLKYTKQYIKSKISSK